MSICKSYFFCYIYEFFEFRLFGFGWKVFNLNFVICLYRWWFWLVDFCSVVVSYSVIFDFILKIFGLFYENILFYEVFIVEFLYCFVSVVCIFEYGVSVFFFEINIVYFVDCF